MSRAIAQATKARGAWEGSIVGEGHIEYLLQHRMLPPVEIVAARIPGREVSPVPQAGEVVVFTKHFARGFGLPASNFFSSFLAHFSLQPHHLAANAVLQLAAYITLCQGFLGIEPRLDHWRRLFFFKQRSVSDGTVGRKRMTNCGAALVHHWTTSGFPKLPLQESVKKWQKGFFYVKSAYPKNDCINRPPFIIAPLPAKLNWKSTLVKPAPEAKLNCVRLDIHKAKDLSHGQGYFVRHGGMPDSVVAASTASDLSDERPA
ncbi:hypothetical protein D1007_26597 [Hordeum vulgare]|nr:hypothetical protein D1007_26597 [Hordeum vulgare]